MVWNGEYIVDGRTLPTSRPQGRSQNILFLDWMTTEEIYNKDPMKNIRA